MIILGIRLKNIRSYTDKAIVFPKNGITVIYGDVGTGKTSILLSITYALFGQPKAKKSDPIQRFAYPRGEDLLRLGSNSGYVRLLIQQSNRLILIERGLKRKPDGKVSDPGGKLIIYQIMNDGEPKLKLVSSRYYSSEELKKKILEILGIPEVTFKQKPLIFTNAIYVPQFGVNDIQNLSDEDRLLLVNKALNLDKYNNIKTNLNKLISQTINKEINGLKYKEAYYEKLLSGINIEELREEINEKRKEIDAINTEINRIEASIEELKSRQKHLEEELKAKENEQKEIEKKYYVIEQNEQQLQKKEEELKRKMKELGISDLSQIGDIYNKIDSKLKEINKKIDDLKEKKNDLLKKKKEYEELRRTLENKINEYTEKVSVTRADINNEKKKLQEKQKELKPKQELLDKGICPVCGQRIPHEHAHKLIMTLKEEINEIIHRINKLEELLKRHQEELRRYKARKSEVEDCITEIDEQIKAIDEETNNLYNIIIELKEKKKDLLGIQDINEEIKELKSKIKDKAFLKKKLDEVNNSIEELNNKIKSIEDEIDSLRDKIMELKGKKIELESNIRNLEDQIRQYDQNLKTYNEIKKERKFMENMKKFLYGDRPRTGLLYKLVELVEERIRGVAYHKFRTLFLEYFLKLMEDHEVIGIDLDEKFKPSIRIRIGSVTGEVSQPSGGQLTSVNLAYRLALNAVARGMTPQLRNSTLILDEPTYGFSPERVEKLRELLLYISGGGKRQIIIVTHDRNLLNVGDCKIKLDLNITNVETKVNYEDCNILPPHYKEFVERLLYEGLSTLETTEERPEEIHGGFKPSIRIKPRKQRGILDFLNK